MGMVRENQREEFIWDDDALGISATLINERITLWLVDGNDQKQPNSKELAWIPIYNSLGCRFDSHDHLFLHFHLLLAIGFL